MLFSIITVVIDYRQKYYFKPYSGGNQFIGVTEDIIDKSYKFKYKTFEQMLPIDAYFEKSKLKNE